MGAGGRVRNLAPRAKNGRMGGRVGWWAGGVEMGPEVAGVELLLFGWGKGKLATSNWLGGWQCFRLIYNLSLVHKLRAAKSGL